MVSRIWTSLNRIEPEEQTYIKRVLYVVGITGLLATAITTATTIPSGYTNLILASAISLGIIVAMLWLTWRNHLSLPRIVFPLLGLIVATYIIRNSDGIRDETMYIFPLTLILAGLLLGKYGVLIFTLLDFAAISIQALGEINGQITDRFSQYTTFESLVVIGVLLAFAGTLLYVTISNLRQNLIQAHVNEKKFADSNRELQGIRNSLEERVNVRTAQLQASAEVGRSAASTLDPEELLRIVTNLITDRFGFYYTAIFLIDPTGRYAVLREATGEAGRVLKERRHQLEISGQSMVGTAITMQHARIALDIRTETARFVNPLLPETRSEIALPLIAGNRILGALDVQSTQAGVFDESSAAVLQSMADQVALSLNNATSYAETQTAARRSQALYTASQKIAQLEANISTVINDVLQTIGQASDFSQWRVATFDPQREQLMSIASQPADDQPAVIRMVDHPGHLLVRSASRSEVVISNSSISGTTQQNSNKQISAPLIARGTSLGALQLGRPANGPDWTDRDRDLVESIAGLIVIAIENHELTQKTEQASAELTAINHRLTGESWNAAARQKAGGVLWISSDDRSDRSSMPEVSEALASGCITTRLIDSSQQLSVAIPIKLRDVSIGALRLAMPHTAWNSELSLTLESIAGHAAQAAENARLLAVTEERFARERILSESTDKIRRKAAVDQILRTAAEELARHLQAGRVAVHIRSAADTNGDLS